MLRRQMDEYLDGVLDPAGCAAVDAAMARDAAARTLFHQIKNERAVRAAAYNSYIPSASETRALIAKFRDAAESEQLAPVGRIGPRWLRHGAGIAAAVAVLIGTFAIGRMSASSQVVTIPGAPVVRTDYSVVTIDTLGDTQVHTFASLDERQAFISDYEARGSGVIAVADLTSSDHM